MWTIERANGLRGGWFSPGGLEISDGGGFDEWKRKVNEFTNG